MYIIKKLLPLSIVASLFIFTACGGSREDTPLKSIDNQNKVSVPKKISMNIPNALKLDRDTSSSKQKVSFKTTKEEDTSVIIKSYGYKQLQKSIQKAEDKVSNIEQNLIYLSKIMPDILNECQDTLENKTCNIDADIIKFPEENISVNLGKITYTHYDSSKKYQHIVQFDLQPPLAYLGDLVTKDLETMKWSTDENHIETLSDVIFDGISNKLKIRYDKAKDSSSKVVITNNYTVDTEKGNLTLQIDEEKDELHTVNIKTAGNIQDYVYEANEAFSSHGTVNDNGGSLFSEGNYSKGKYLDVEYAEKETFDSTGRLLQSSFCDSERDCKISDISTWIKFDEQNGIVEEFNDTSFDDTFSDDKEENLSEPLELTFTHSENFPKYTNCWILPLGYNTNSLEESSILKNSVGAFSRYEDELFGEILGYNDETIINTLPIVCNTFENSEFSLITEEIRPILGLKK